MLIISGCPTNFALHAFVVVVLCTCKMSLQNSACKGGLDVCPSDSSFDDSDFITLQHDGQTFKVIVY